MVVGIIVTVASVVYHANGAVCYVSLVNSTLGLLMYSSYFALFLQLFLNHYVYAKPAKAGGKAGEQAVAAAADATNKARDPKEEGAKAATKKK